MEREEDRAWAEELDNLLKRRNAHEQRLATLEQQHAHYGRATPAHIVTEIKEIQAKILDLNNQINPIEVPKFLDRMSELERSKYNTALIMGLQAAFVENRTAQREDMRGLRADLQRAQARQAAMLIAGIAVAFVVGAALQDITLTTWHLWAFVAVFVGVLAYVLYDLYQAGK